MADVGANELEEMITGSPKLAVMAPPAQRERPVTNLGKVFGQFAELQQQIAEQVGALEESVYQQRQDVAAAISELPDMRERINWLMASFFEQSRKDESVREKLNRHDAALATLVEAVRSIHQAQAQWQSALEDILRGLTRVNATPIPALPQF
jgi:chromosome segregation ATPase